MNDSSAPRHQLDPDPDPDPDTDSYDDPCGWRGLASARPGAGGAYMSKGFPETVWMQNAEMIEIIVPLAPLLPNQAMGEGEGEGWGRLGRGKATRCELRANNKVLSVVGTRRDVTVSASERYVPETCTTHFLLLRGVEGLATHSMHTLDTHRVLVILLDKVAADGMWPSLCRSNP
jgi:hypothetical protein